jgi:serine/threonine-protein kinase HipA
MATKQWGKVYLYDRFAGILAEEPGGRFVFTYDADYVAENCPPLSYTMPVSLKPYYNEQGLHPYFDNLVAEGWLRDAQVRALGIKKNNRFGLLLAFGKDCIGAVSIVDPEPREIRAIELDDPEQVAALAGRASLSGIQPKLTARKVGKHYQAATKDLQSTHIAKLPSHSLPNILELELLTLNASRALLPDDRVAKAELASIGSEIPKALLIQRFDREPDGTKRHFEEFNQILGKDSEDKYDGAYEQMGEFIRKTPSCIPAEVEKLYRRILVAVLTGNTDAHFKNFAMFHTTEGLRLTPSYDLIAAGIYKEYQTFALSLGGAKDIRLGDIKPKHLITLGEAYGLPHGAIKLVVDDLGKRLEKAKEIVMQTDHASNGLKDSLIQLMEKRWNGNFSSIGQHLLKRPSGGAKLSDLLKPD